MKKWMKYIMLGAMAIIVCYLYAHIDKVHDVYDEKTDNSSYISAIVMGDSYVSQSFQCTEDSIDGISLKILLGGESKSGELEYRLLDRSGKELINGTYPIAEIKSERINKIKFEKAIENTAGNSYTVSLRVTGFKENESLAIYFDPVGEKSGELYVNGEEKQGTLVLQWITHRFDVETFIVTLGFIIYFIVFFKILYRLFS